MARNQRRVLILGRREPLIEVARHLRKVATRSESLLWNALRRRCLEGVKFRRQHPIGPFIVDLYAPRYRLAVEIDGPAHDGQEQRDRERQGYLERRGLRVLRLRSEEVEADVEAAADRIASALRISTSPPNPLL